MDGTDRPGDQSGNGSDARTASAKRTGNVSGWHERTPSGWRDGVDEEEAARNAAREKQDQKITTQDRAVRKFTGAQIVAHLTGDMKLTRTGDLALSLVVPYEFKHLAYCLSDAYGIPLSIDVQIWKPFEEANG